MVFVSLGLIALLPNTFQRSHDGMEQFKGLDVVLT